MTARAIKKEIHLWVNIFQPSSSNLIAAPNRNLSSDFLTITPPYKISANNKFIIVGFILKNTSLSK
ncbi:uncharacterized protein METZ01_LOCUS232102 [marine metagenome]|uniref:Uncharacterized protein n=1 Tax=marine metagenome TaxID=408172 RepID=A0A382GVZ7_9ZZZZ